MRALIISAVLFSIDGPAYFTALQLVAALFFAVALFIYRYIGLRRDFIVNAESKEEALEVVGAYNFRTFGTGLYRGWIRTITAYKGGKTTRTTQDLRQLQTV